MGAAQQRDQRVQLRAHPADRQQQPCRSAAMPRARHDLLDLRTERERHRRPQKRAGRVAQPVESAAIATRVEDLKHFDRGGQRRAKQHSKNQRHRRTRAPHHCEEGRYAERHEHRDVQHRIAQNEAVDFIRPRAQKNQKRILTRGVEIEMERVKSAVENQRDNYRQQRTH